MEGIMIGNVSIINPKLVTGPNSTSTTETKVRMPTATEKMLVTAVTPSQVLSPHLRIRGERKSQDSKKRNRSRRMILRNGPDASMMSNVTGIKGDHKQLLNPSAYRIETSVNYSDSGPLGSLSDASAAQINIIRMLQHVSEGRNVDLLA